MKAKNQPVRHGMSPGFIPQHQDAFNEGNARQFPDATFLSPAMCSAALRGPHSHDGRANKHMIHQIRCH